MGPTAHGGRMTESPRTQQLAKLDAYYAGTQYEGLPHSWDKAIADTGAAIPFRQRKPSTIIPLPKLIVDSFCRALCGAGRRPIASIDGATGTADNGALAKLMREGRVIKAMREATRRALSIGTGIVVWKIVEGKLHTEAWDAKDCRPTFKPGGFPVLDAL